MSIYWVLLWMSCHVYLLFTKHTAGFEWGSKTRESSAPGTIAMWLFCRLSHFQWCLRSVADRGAVWSLWQSPVGKSQHSEDFGGNPYSPFEKEVLACSWALVETEYLTTGHQFTVWPRLPIIHGCYLMNEAIKLDMHINTLHNMEVIYAQLGPRVPWKHE